MLIKKIDMQKKMNKSESKVTQVFGKEFADYSLCFVTTGLQRRL